MSEIGTNGINKPQTLCWDCANATGSCSWSDHFDHKPVDGWEAIETTIKVHNPSCDADLNRSYVVISCPEFIRDAECGGTVRIGKKQKVKTRKEIDTEAVITAYQCGVKIHEIETVTGCPHVTIYRILKDAGITPGKCGERKKYSTSAGWAEAARKRGPL